VLNDKMTAEVETLWKEAVVAYFTPLAQRLLWEVWKTRANS